MVGHCKVLLWWYIVRSYCGGTWSTVVVHCKVGQNLGRSAMCECVECGMSEKNLCLLSHTHTHTHMHTYTQPPTVVCVRYVEQTDHLVCPSLMREIWR